MVARRQLVELGCTDADLARLVRRRALARVHRGVYVDHTGPLTAEQRAWAAVLFFWPAALCHETALAWDLNERRVRDAQVHVAVDSSRRVSKLAGTTVHRVTGFDALVLDNLSPPRVRVEQAALEVAATARSERRAVAVLADACQSHRTTATRLLRRLDAMPRLRHRRLLRMVLRDVASGAYSVLERKYLCRVERLHGLPTGRRQHRASAGRAIWFRDVEYVDQRVIVELDGRLGHSAADDRWADLDRDVSAVVSHRITIRLGYGQVLQPCRVATALAQVLIARGWAGRPRPCGPDCPVVPIDGDSHAPGESNSPMIA